ncbi:hypothetical protein DUPY_36360 [Duganella phyllosphaerae]|uniref:Uncharacterized protein n=1 Tax=Duganella phyllosphaerae TaxID=762836 RepID=A0A1E7WG54_9BURK|nr:hypothetical protein DUPY_36360 [Duganella phyllosphaerae]
MQHRDAFHQCQSQPQAALGAVGRALGLGKQVEHARQQFGRHADAVIGDGERDLAAVVAGFQRQHHFATLRRVLGGVVEQVGQRLHQPGPVAAHVQLAGRQAQHQRVMACFEQGPRLFDGAVDDGHQLQVVLLELHQPTRDARDVEQIVHQVGHVFHLPDDDVAGVLDRLFMAAAQFEQLGGSADRCKRVA